MNDQTHIRRTSSGPVPSDMYRVQVVSDLAGLARIKPDWDALVARDPQAGIFLSHDWLLPALQAHPKRWRIFVLRDGQGRAICIFPAKYRLHWSQSRGQFQTELEAAGRFIWGEYTGFICDPGREEDGLHHMGLALRSMPWKTISLRYEPTGTRMERFAAALGDGFSAKFREYRINQGTTNNLISPQIPLAADFDTYLTDRVSANTRQKIRRQRRNLLESGTYTLTTSTVETVDRDVSMLLTNWLANWGSRKSDRSAARLAQSYGQALLNAESLGALHLVALWQGEQMLGGLGHIVDWANGSSHFLVAGRDPKAEDPAIGLLLHSAAIEWAIEHGLTTYDFGHGDEPYKFSFGPDKVPMHYMTIRRDGGEDVFDPFTLKRALKRLADFAKAGQTDRVAQGAAQLSATYPD